MKLKRNIAVAVACLLLICLGAAMIGGCGKEAAPQWEGIATPTTQTISTAEPEATVEIVDRGDEDFTTATNPSDQTNPTTAPAAPTEPTEPSYGEDGYMTYESYLALGGEKQMEYMRTFPSLKEFNDWYNAAKKAYEEAHPKETITDGNITLD